MCGNTSLLSQVFIPADTGIVTVTLKYSRLWFSLFEIIYIIINNDILIIPLGAYK